MIDDDTNDGEPPQQFNAARDGVVYVCDRLCDSCIFRSGNRMALEPGRVADMVESATKEETAIICHETLYGPGPQANALCRGFFDLQRTSTIQIASRLGLVRFVEPPGMH